MTPVLSIAGLEVSLGGRRVLRGVALALERGTITVSYTHLTLPTKA